MKKSIVLILCLLSPALANANGICLPKRGGGVNCSCTIDANTTEDKCLQILSKCGENGSYQSIDGAYKCNSGR